jgi:hypothetical protein
MKRALRLGIAVALTLSMQPAVQAQSVAPAQQPRTSADERLKALYDGYSEWNAKESGYFENARGETEPSDYLAHVDEATQLRYAAHLRELLTQLNAIPTDQLSPGEKVKGRVLWFGERFAGHSGRRLASTLRRRVTRH